MRPALTPLPPDAIWGGCEVRRGDPGIAVLEDVFVLPYRRDAPWGVFDRSGALVMDATDLRLPSGDLMGQAPLSHVAYDEVTEEADEAELTYAGRLHGHYGHFLLESLSRLWPLANGRPLSGRLLMHAEDAKAVLFGLDHVATIFRALGVSEADIVIIDRPMRVRRLTVPRASFQQQAFAYDAFGALCRRIGANVRGGRGGLAVVGRSLAARLKAPGKPLYVSKRWLTSGVRRIDNEAEIEAVLRAAGVDVFYPELAPFAEQLELFASRPVILGTAGSAFHTSAFLPRPKRTILVNPEPTLNANFRIFDALTGARPDYVHAETEELPLRPDQAFARNFRFTRPREIAEELLRMI